VWLANVYDCLRRVYSFLGKTKILNSSFDIFKKQYTEPEIVGKTKMLFDKKNSLLKM